jgi:tetratricopeptide (TPR) repeat protein
VPPANADGGIETTALDLLKFDQALYGETLLGDAYKKMMFTPNLSNYGYCWRITQEFGNTVISHGGGAPGVSAQFKRYIDDGYTLIILSNYDRGAITVTRTIEAILFDQPYEMPKPGVGEFLYKKLLEKGIDSVIRQFDDLINENGYRIGRSSPLNEFGYALLGENKLDWAIGIFKLNTRLFPAEANPYDSLGDAYLQKGDRESAAEAFKKALEIDPNFSSSKEKLEALLEER